MEERGTVNGRIRGVAVTGVFSALVIVLGVSGLGFIPFPSGALTIIHVPVIIAAILEGPGAGLCTGLLFGVLSLVQAAVAGVTPVDLAFLQHPWIAVVPRILIGPAAWFTASLVNGGLFAGRAAPADDSRALSGFRWFRESAGILLGSVTGSLVNTVLVLFALRLVLPEILTWPVLLALVSVNGAAEAALSAALSLAVILPWKGISRRRGSRLKRRA